MKPEFDYFLFDTNNLFWRVWTSICKKYLTHEITGNLYSRSVEDFFKRVDDIYNTYATAGAKCYFLFDNPKSKINIRKTIDPDYKNSRQGLPPEAYQVLKILTQIILCKDERYRVVKIDQYEADDLTLPLKDSFRKENKDSRVLCLSNDLDWARNIDSNCQWFNWYNLFDEKEFFKKFGFWPKKESLKIYKSIKGDRADAIPVGIPYFPDKVLRKLLKENSTLDEVIESLYSNHSNLVEKLNNNKERLKLNYQLVDFIPINENIEDHILYGKKRKYVEVYWLDLLKINNTLETLTPKNLFRF